MSFISHSENRVAAKLTVAVAVGLTELVSFFGEKMRKKVGRAGAVRRRSWTRAAAVAARLAHINHTRSSLLAKAARLRPSVCLTD